LRRGHGQLLRANGQHHVRGRQLLAGPTAVGQSTGRGQGRRPRRVLGRAVMILKKLGRNDEYVISLAFGNNAALLTNGSVTIPIRDYLEIVEAAESHTVLATDGSAVTLTIEKLTGTQAPAAGANMFKTSTFNMK